LATLLSFQEISLARGDDKNHKSNRSENRRGHHGGPKPQYKTITSVKGGQLPKWVRDEIVRSTPKDRREPALGHLSKAMEYFADERYPAAANDLRKAKELSPRSSTIRELLGLSAYRSGQWDEALRELRTFRRLTGDLIHYPVEMDCLRGLGRHDDVIKAWDRLQDYDISATINHEARVVYASFLLDQGRARDAWPVIKPGRLIASPSPGELRRWFVAARVAMEAGDKDAARRLVAALDEQELDFDGIDELRRALADPA
jgi:tetratricopeptide (TPR) repeat protein